MPKKTAIVILVGLSSALLAHWAVVFLRGGSTSARDECVQNLHAIEMAKARWAIEETNTAASAYLE
jgi:hypothetical protein